MFSLIPRTITTLHDSESRKMLEIRYNRLVLVRFRGCPSIILIGICSMFGTQGCRQGGPKFWLHQVIITFLNIHYLERGRFAYSAVQTVEYPSPL
ncbi:uncharacterized protein K444DRAFT_285095 [Hyaloscypha bicolor E]|uniref:Uncharacterized protein n=1 Tax=Hyaloscypha bicolor E TaxID=1095630 RepID=A0A2J6SGH8_9HELO|nr:uncharacterized protein K444DRAFT_285095 [Hyaloscypha bicolor E]PMD49882.1 hypothetical protein K444DRAFT_285095 [Hyaloscypha bicolor E]